MKIEVYFPHDAFMQNRHEVADMMEKEKAAGYGFYWALLEYLRMQEDYVGDIRAIRGVARRTGVRLDKATRVMNNYGLFVIEGKSFYSPYMIEGMKPLEEKRMRRRLQKQSEEEALSEQSVQKDLSNSLEINDSFSKSKEKKNKVKSTSSDVADKLNWEAYVDALRDEPQWLSVMAKRGRFSEGFVKRFDEVLKHFKQHVMAVGNEQNIRSLNDAKRYFNNYNKPGSITHERLAEELRKPVEGACKYETRDPVTGMRSYCGVPIPPEAPLRPNDQAVWCNGKWVY